MPLLFGLGGCVVSFEDAPFLGRSAVILAFLLIVSIVLGTHALSQASFATC